MRPWLYSSQECYDTSQICRAALQLTNFTGQLAIRRFESFGDDFFLRSLSTSDVNDEYLAWFQDPVVQQYIASAYSMYSISILKEYIKLRERRPDCVFLGIFKAVANTLIGTIKFEPIDLGSNTAEIGILIGDVNYRGRGLGRDVIYYSTDWLKETLGITTYTLGVDSRNKQAYKSYSAVGFQVLEYSETGSARMLLKV